MNGGHYFARFASPEVLGVVRAAIIVTALPAALVSCCDFNNTCTDLGCIDDGLRVELEGTFPPTLTVDVIAADGERRTHQCTDAHPCSILFEGFYPELVTVRVTWDGNTEMVTARPKYTESWPNGRCCPPPCRTATVSIAL